MKPSVKFICATALAAGASFAALEATKSMPLAAFTQTGAPPFVQTASYPFRHPEGDPNQGVKKHDEKGYPANPGASPPRGAARERYRPRDPSGKPRRFPELQ